MADRLQLTAPTTKIGIVLAAFLVLGLSILSRPDWKLRDFDQVFYVTIAYDLDRYGVFSDGIFDPVDSSVQPAQPGMFFGPVFPAMILAVMNLDQGVSPVYTALKTVHENDTIFILEVLLQRYVYGRPLEVKRDTAIREAVLYLLDALVDGGSSAAFRMRDDFVTPASAN